jgi:hypothetical protein
MRRREARVEIAHCAPWSFNHARMSRRCSINFIVSNERFHGFVKAHSQKEANIKCSEKSCELNEN